MNRKRKHLDPFFERSQSMNTYSTYHTWYHTTVCMLISCSYDVCAFGKKLQRYVRYFMSYQVYTLDTLDKLLSTSILGGVLLKDEQKRTNRKRRYLKLLFGRLEP